LARIVPNIRSRTVYTYIGQNHIHTYIYIYIRCIYVTLGKVCTKYTVTYGIYIHTHIYNYGQPYTFVLYQHVQLLEQQRLWDECRSPSPIGRSLQPSPPSTQPQQQQVQHRHQQQQHSRLHHHSLNPNPSSNHRSSNSSSQHRTQSKQLPFSKTSGDLSNPSSSHSNSSSSSSQHHTQPKQLPFSKTSSDLERNALLLRSSILMASPVCVHSHYNHNINPSSSTSNIDNSPPHTPTYSKAAASSILQRSHPQHCVESVAHPHAHPAADTGLQTSPPLDGRLLTSSAAGDGASSLQAPPNVAAFSGIVHGRMSCTLFADQSPPHRTNSPIHYHPPNTLYQQQQEQQQQQQLQHHHHHHHAVHVRLQNGPAETHNQQEQQQAQTHQQQHHHLYLDLHHPNYLRVSGGQIFHHLVEQA